MSVTDGKRAASKKALAKPAAKRREPVNKFVPSNDQRQLVTLSLGFGMTEEQARLLIISPRTGEPVALHTFKKVFAAEREAAAAKMEAMLAGKLYGHAMGTGKGAVTAGIFLLKAKFGYRDRTENIEVEHDAPKGKMRFTMKMEG